MPRYEYKVIPAPKKAGKIKGVKGTDQKFALELSNLMNEYGSEGWEYQRTDTLPCEERQGLTGRTTTYQNMLIFRREINEVTEPVRRLEHFPDPVAVAPPPAPVAPPAPVEAAPEPIRQPIFTSASARQEPIQEQRVTPETTSEPVPSPAAPEPAPMAVPTFRSAAMAPAPRLSATSEVPEGKAPPIAAQ